MLLQRQHFLLSYFKTLSVGLAGVKLTTSHMAARCSTESSRSSLAFKNISQCYSIAVHFKYDDDVFDLRCLNSKTKTLTKFIREAQYADCKLLLYSLMTVQHYSYCYPHTVQQAVKEDGSLDNIKKTETMSIGEQIHLNIDGHKLKRVDCFKYIRSYMYVTKDCKADVEITAQIQGLQSVHHPCNDLW